MNISNITHEVSLLEYWGGGEVSSLTEDVMAWKNSTDEKFLNCLIPDSLNSYLCPPPPTPTPNSFYMNMIVKDKSGGLVGVPIATLMHVPTLADNRTKNNQVFVLISCSTLNLQLNV